MTPYVPAHVTDEQLERFRRNDVAPDELLFISRHSAACDACTSRMRAMPTQAGDLQTLHDALGGNERAHRSYLPYAAAAAIAIVLAGMFFFSRRTRSVVPVTSTAHAVVTGIPEKLPAPTIIAELRGVPDELRGTPAGAAARLVPSGVVIESTTPQFMWPNPAGARFAVTVFNENKDIVAESGELRTGSWTPPSPLARGINYSWEVEVRQGDQATILPSPPAPPARFRVLDDASLRDIEAARRRSPNDHLLLGVLYAQAGVRGRAEEELSASTDPAAQVLLAEVRRW